jgi:hypothetical protein
MRPTSGSLPQPQARLACTILLLNPLHVLDGDDEISSDVFLDALSDSFDLRMILPHEPVGSLRGRLVYPGHVSEVKLNGHNRNPSSFMPWTLQLPTQSVALTYPTPASCFCGVVAGDGKNPVSPPEPYLCVTLCCPWLCCHAWTLNLPPPKHHPYLTRLCCAVLPRRSCSMPASA